MYLEYPLSDEQTPSTKQIRASVSSLDLNESRSSAVQSQPYEIWGELSKVGFQVVISHRMLPSNEPAP